MWWGEKNYFAWVQSPSARVASQVPGPLKHSSHQSEIIHAANVWHFEEFSCNDLDNLLETELPWGVYSFLFISDIVTEGYVFTLCVYHRGGGLPVIPNSATRCHNVPGGGVPYGGNSGVSSRASSIGGGVPRKIFRI